MIELWESRVALLMIEGMNVGMEVGVELPFVGCTGVRIVVTRGLSPYRP
jgi:hypothetical protein